MRKKLFTFLLALAASVGLSWATDPIVIPTNTEQSSYTQGDITITCSKPGDFSGFYLDKSENETATITNSGSSTISQIVLGIGWFPDDRSYVRANGAEPTTSSDPYSITFSNVNSNNVTLTITNGKIQISDVTITLADEGGSAQAGLQVTELQVPSSWADNPTMLSTSDMPGFVAITEAEATAWDAAPAGNVVLIFAFEGDGATSLSFKDGVYQAAQAHNITYEDLYGWSVLGRQIFYTGGGSTPAVDPTPTPSATGGIFANCYDCWRDPEYPTISGQCYLHYFGNPGVGNGNPSGPWKLEFVENYNSSSTKYDSNIVKSYAASEYGKSPEQMEVYRLYQWQNGAYQPVAYGVLYAYANENNAVEHAAFFEADGYWGCYLTGNTHSYGDNVYVTFNEDASTGFADLHGGSTPAVDPEPTPSGDGDKLAGAFSVGGDKVVYFSKANLQATTADNGATWTWGFAENQWDYVGNNAANTSFGYWGETGNGSYDLFGWIGESSALDDYRQYGIGSNYDFTDYGNTAGEDLKADWGSLMGSDWRTLTYDEWQYLIKSRNNAANLLAYATVNGKTGLILLPDSWASSSVALTITTANYTTNIISASDWSTLEEQGCVFLPAAGSRDDTSVSGVGVGGDYWSSSSPSGKQYDEGSAYCFFFDTDFSKQADGMHFNKRGRGYGLSVRLVSETAPTPTSAGLQVTELEIPDSWQNDPTLVTISDLTGFVAVSLEEAGAWDAVPAGDVVLIYAGTNEGVTATYFHNGAWGDPVPFGGFSRADIFEWASGSKIFYTSGGSTPAVDPTPTPSGDANIFIYSYECDRSQYYPTKDNACNVYSFENEAVGQWKVEFLENYDRNNTAYANAEDLWYVLGNYYNSVPGFWEEEAFWAFIDEHPVPVFTLSKWNGAEYQFVSYGLVLAYANPSNAVEHAAVFRATDGSFRYLTDNAHGVNDDFNITFDSDLTDGLQDLVPEPSVPTDQEIADAVIALINVIPNPVAYNDECKDAIDAARAAYDALNADQKALVENYGVLLDAETAYAQLIPHPNGECGAQGDNLLWEFNPSTGTLTITGSGAMADWHDDTQRPWYSYYGQITSVVLPEGLTTIGEKAFRGCTNLASINMAENYPASLTTIKQEAFCHTGLTSITIPATVVSIEQDAFYLSQSITDVYCYADPNNLTWNDNYCDDFVRDARSAVCHVKECAYDDYYAKWGGTDCNTFPNSSTQVNLSFVGDMPGECGGGSTPNSIVINGTPAVGDNSISLTYYFDPANVPGITDYAPTLKVKCVTDNIWDEIWLSLSEIKSGTTTITLNTLGEFEAGKSYEVCFAYYNGSWVDEMFQSFSFDAPAPTDEQVATNEDPENPGAYYYSTFFHSTQNYALTNDGTTAFIADLSGNDLVLTEIAKGTQVIPMNTAVILRKSGSNEPVVLAPTSEPGVSFEANNDLQGVDEQREVEGAIDGLTTENCYVLSGTNEYGVGFYRINGTLLKAHKAFVKYVSSSANPAPRRMRFIFDQATGVENVSQEPTANSQKLIENGVLYIIRDGVRYNAQGQVVK